MGLYPAPVPGARRMMQTGRQRGVALLTALLIVALAAVAAAAISRDQFLDLHRVQNLLYADQAYEHALGVEDWGRGVLLKDLQHDQSTNAQMDAPGEAWSVPLPSTAVEGGSVQGRIEDMQGRFNLNNLVAVPATQGDTTGLQLAYLQRLLLVLELDPALAQAIADWLDTDVDARFPGGAEDLTYMRANPPYRSGNAPMGDISELLLVHGITPKIYARLAPYVTVLPNPTPINVNTAPAPVLLALSSEFNDHTVEAVMAARAAGGFADVPAFFAAIGLGPEASGAAAPPSGAVAVEPGNAQSAPATGSPTEQIAQLIGVRSDFFMVHAQTQVDRIEVQLNSLIARGAIDGPKVIARTRVPY